MAKKGQGFKKYTEEFRMKVVSEYLYGNNGGSMSLRKNIIYQEGQLTLRFINIKNKVI